MQLRLKTDKEATENKLYCMNDPDQKQDDQEQTTQACDQDLYDECLKQAEGNEARAQVYYNHRRKATLDPDCEDLDQSEKWPMLTPLLILYTLGTIGVLALVFGFLASRLGWW